MRNCWNCLPLGSDPANEVTIVSGRPAANARKWFGGLPISLIAEHGVWLRIKIQTGAC
jgi:trehalose 6-phosphate synthase/phosphatase